MAFLTGVDLLGHERQRAAEEREGFSVVRRRPSPQKASGHCLELMDHEPVEYGNLLKKAIALNDEDPMEELRRMVNQTRTKMDAQRKVLDGFISDVRNIEREQKNFSCSDVALASTPSSGGAISSGGAVRALGNNQRGPEAIADYPTSNVMRRASSTRSAISLRPSSGGRSQVLRSARPPASGAAGMAQSNSTPALKQFASGMPLSELSLPPRRAPPGPGPTLAAASSGASSFARRKQEGASGGRHGCGGESLARFPSLTRTKLPKFDCIGA
eukprot:TRINITY_DN56732_c0_g1_i1.p1 TRINITY_DN56732_c0_g1~~TRINITY_DN56732_c0_g1_i1.p1  ORF type:complete len:272 (-),score=34.40 TRINITY_DN56732_c0_g1_i1:118-933(-)